VRCTKTLMAALVAAACLSACQSARTPGRSASPAVPSAPAAPAGAAPQAGALPSLPPPGGQARTWDDYHLRAAQRLVQANASGSYTGVVPEVLLAIPVLEVELNADGSVRKVEVLRYPSQAPETAQMAIDAVYRAAPYGSVAHLPRPWRFAEAFLFNDQRRFKPRTLDR
jgi:hypothetical protein